MTHPLDISIFRAINGLAGKNAVLDAVGWFCARGLIVAMFLAVGLRAWWLLRHPESAAEGGALLLAGARGSIAAMSAFLLSVLASPYLFRARPYVTLENVTRLMGAPLTAHSFPSSHAAAAFALACAVFLTDRAFGGVLLAAAAAVGFGRVFVGVHYPSDVLAGAAFGSAWAWAVAYLSSVMIRRP